MLDLQHTTPFIIASATFDPLTAVGRLALATGYVLCMLTSTFAFALLLSPSKFDFSQPVRVLANGRTVFDARVEPSVATLLKWAARDNDRTMLFGAELNIDLTK